MLKLNKKVFFILLLVVSGYFIYSYFDSEESEIRKIASEISEKASFINEDLHPFIILKKGKELTNYCYETISIDIDYRDSNISKIITREDVIKYYTLARKRLLYLNASYDRLNIRIKNNQAEVKTNIITKYQLQGFEPEVRKRPVSIKLEKISGSWLITRVESLYL